MEILNWINKNFRYGYGDGSGYGDGYGYGDGSGYGDGNGYGDGSGYGSGYGYGYGSGEGSGYGYGYGSGEGSGYGDGSGSGEGSGYGNGSGYGYGYKLNNEMTYKIDAINTIIKSIKGNIAKGFIVNNNLSLSKTYIVKDADSQYFAHGISIKEAMESLQDKIIANMDTDEVIDMFLLEIDVNKKYPANYFFDWHGKLTGSCLQGRETFIKNNNIDLENDLFDLNKFIELTINEYGNDVIKQVKERLEQKGA